MPTLFHIHDPMCSWCWGYRHTWGQLQTQLPDTVHVVNVVGGLAPDTDTPMPVEQQRTIAGYWKDVSDRTGARFNFDFWEHCQPRRSTYPACRAVLVARRFGLENEMINAIQRAYYLRAMNPSDNETLVLLATELGVDDVEFAHALVSPGIERELQEEFGLRRSLGVNSFPSLVLANGEVLCPLEVNYLDYAPTLLMIEEAIS